MPTHDRITLVILSYNRADELPGPRLVGFMAGACAVRRNAFLHAGGYERRYFICGEEELLALDLIEPMSSASISSTHCCPRPRAVRPAC